jgi:hypothetical protein
MTHSEGLDPHPNPAEGDTWKSPGMRVPHTYRDGFWIPSQGKIPSDPASDAAESANAAGNSSSEPPALDPAASEAAADTLIDAVTGGEGGGTEPVGTDANGSPVVDESPEPPEASRPPEGTVHDLREDEKAPEEAPPSSGGPPLSEDDIEKLTKARRKEAAEALEKDEPRKKK